MEIFSDDVEVSNDGNGQTADEMLESNDNKKVTVSAHQNLKALNYNNSFPSNVYNLLETTGKLIFKITSISSTKFF